jgi:hypothetical protein
MYLFEKGETPEQRLINANEEMMNDDNDNDENNRNLDRQQRRGKKIFTKEHFQLFTGVLCVHFTKLFSFIIIISLFYSQTKGNISSY